MFLKLNKTIVNTHFKMLVDYKGKAAVAIKRNNNNKMNNSRESNRSEREKLRRLKLNKEFTNAHLVYNKDAEYIE